MGLFPRVLGESGVYTPIIREVVNIDSTTPGEARWIRVGRQVFVSGSIVVDPTLGGPTTTAIGISLPIQADFAAPADLAGVFFGNGGLDAARFIANPPEDDAQTIWLASHTAAEPYTFEFGYGI